MAAKALQEKYPFLIFLLNKEEERRIGEILRPDVREEEFLSDSYEGGSAAGGVTP